jgi:uncharacterized protein YcbX
MQGESKLIGDSNYDKASVSRIVIYPIKGCRGQVLESVEVTEMGLVGDREFAVVLDGQRANQKQLPLLYQLSAQWVGEHSLVLSFPNAEAFTLDARLGTSCEAVDIYSKQVPVLDMGGEVADWLSGVLQGAVRLVRIAQPVKWFFPLEEFSQIHDKDQSKFIDVAPVLLANQNSLDDLNDKISVAHETPALSMDRFRANIIVSGLTPYLEDELPVFDFPHLSLSRVAVCERCIVTTTDPETGVRGKEPLRTLSQYRKRKNDYAGGIMFGIYLVPEAKGTISVGDVLGLESV